MIPAPVPGFQANAARALFDGDAYREMTAMLARASASIRMEFFLFGGCQAEAMIALAAQKRAAGVEVRVTLDRTQGMLPLVRRECRAACRRLDALGLDVALSDPRPFPNSPDRPPMAHNKILVVDDREALVGGMNVGTLFFRHHDVMIHLVGPTARALARQFDFDRQFVLDRSLPRSPGSPRLAPFSGTADDARGPETLARVVGTGVGRRTTREAILQNLGAARRSVCVAMCEMGDSDVLDALVAAWEQRGLDVRVLLDPLKMEEYAPAFLGGLRSRLPAGILNARALEKLLRAKVPVRLYRAGPRSEFALMHLKMALFDGGSAVVGSTNWTPGGFGWVGETDVELHGGEVIAQMQAQFEFDWQQRSIPAGPPTRPARICGRLYERFVS